MRIPGFRLFWLGLTLTAVGSRATATANLWQIQELTDSTIAVGVVSLLEGIAVIGLAPLGGTIADRMDRRRLLQIAQATSLLSSVVLAALTFAGRIAPLWIYAAGTLVAAAATFDTPARRSLVPAIVPRERIIDAFALLQPAEQLARLAGPAIAGLLIAAYGAGAVYAFDAVTYAVLIVTLAFIGFRKMEAVIPQTLLSSMVEGFGYVRQRRLLWQLMALDFVAVFFAAYRVLLPALARDVFLVGAAGYGLLSAAPAAGAVLGAGTVYRLRNMKRKGALVLGATAAYGLAALGLGSSPAFALAVFFAGALGFFDALTVTVRHAVLQLETPDRLRGRVSSVYQMVARGGPALGQAQMGALATALGPPIALAVGAAITVGYTLWLAVLGHTVRDYEG
jgi:MFS family permease